MNLVDRVKVFFGACPSCTRFKKRVNIDVKSFTRPLVIVPYQGTFGNNDSEQRASERITVYNTVCKGCGYVYERGFVSDVRIEEEKQPFNAESGDYQVIGVYYKKMNDGREKEIGRRVLRTVIGNKK